MLGILWAPGGGLQTCPIEPKNALLKDIALLKYIKIIKTTIFLGQCNGQTIEPGTKVLMDMLGIQGGLRGPPKQPQNG